MKGAVDLVVASPPFISSARISRSNLLELEPREAFDAGPYGLTLHQRIAREASAWLAPCGWLLLEFGEGQALQVERLIERAGAYDGLVLFEGPAGFVNAIGARRG